MTAARQVTVEAVCTGRAAPIETKSGRSGIDKRARDGRVAVHRLGLEGDEIVDTDNHGGVDQAVYCYCRSDYEWWEAELGGALPAGRFGENLTLAGLANADVAVGDRFGCRGLELEVTSPRIPCATFAAHMADSQFVSRFFRANRTGFYCRVIGEGAIAAGDRFDFVPFDGPRVPVAELVERHGYRKLDAATVARFRAAPIHVGLAALLAERYPTGDLA
ncbi:MAG: MOSC domain-containing protein [Rhizobiaceae bacterium]|nr:MOSC domain-containing protein [Rhizobiaceae bacterium]